MLICHAEIWRAIKVWLARRTNRTFVVGKPRTNAKGESYGSRSLRKAKENLLKQFRLTRREMEATRRSREEEIKGLTKRDQILHAFERRDPERFTGVPLKRRLFLRHMEETVDAKFDKLCAVIRFTRFPKHDEELSSVICRKSARQNTNVSRADVTMVYKRLPPPPAAKI